MAILQRGRGGIISKSMKSLGSLFATNLKKKNCRSWGNRRADHTVGRFTIKLTYLTI